MPGGALFSAPMVKVASKRLDITPAQKGVSVMTAIVMGRTRIREIPLVLTKNFPLNMVVLVFGIMIFKFIIKDCGCINETALFLRKYNVPVILVFALMPFLAGVLTGISVGFVGISFPIVIGLVEARGYNISHVVLAFGMGFVGVILSPVHLCLLVTKDYFQASFSRVYTSLLLPVLPVVGTIILLFLLY